MAIEDEAFREKASSSIAITFKEANSSLVISPTQSLVET